MTYPQFLETLLTPISSFFQWATTLTNALINNYFFITIVGFTLITSLIYMFLDHFTSFNINFTKKHDLDKGGKK